MGCGSVGRVHPVQRGIDVRTLAASRTGLSSSPDQRSEIWPRLLDVADIDQRSLAAALEASINNADESILRVIDADVPRTDRDLQQWRCETALEPLRKLLILHSKEMPSVSYFQGMNDVAAVFLDTLGLPLAYCAFSAWVCRTELNWLQNLEGIWTQSRAVLDVLRANDRKLAERLEACSILPEQPAPFLFQAIFLRLKREMANYEEVRKLWEVAWAARVTLAEPHFELLLVAALVLRRRRALLSTTELSGAQRVLNDLVGTQTAAPLLDSARGLQRLPSVRVRLAQLPVPRMSNCHRHLEKKTTFSFAGGNRASLPHNLSGVTPKPNKLPEQLPGEPSKLTDEFASVAQDQAELQ